MKRTLAFVITAILIALLVIPAGAALADQDYHTIMLPISLTQDGIDAGHTLRTGHLTTIHTEGPVNGLIRVYELNGALPDTTYQICYVFPDEPYYYVAFYYWEDIHTDKNGNGSFFQRVPPGGGTSVPQNMKIVFIEGGTPTPYGPYWLFYEGDEENGGTRALETEVFEICFDQDW